MSNVITMNRELEHRELDHLPDEAESGWSGIRSNPAVSTLVLAGALVLSGAIFVSFWTPAPVERGILFLYQGAGTQDPSGMVESAGPVSPEPLDITLDGSPVTGAAGAGFAHSFELGPGDHVLTLKGQLLEPLHARIVKLGTAQAGNTVVWQKTIQPEELSEGFKTVLAHNEMSGRKEAP